MISCKSCIAWLVLLAPLYKQPSLHPLTTTEIRSCGRRVKAEREGEQGGEEKRPRRERERMVICRHGHAMALMLWLMCALCTRLPATCKDRSGGNWNRSSEFGISTTPLCALDGSASPSSSLSHGCEDAMILGIYLPASETAASRTMPSTRDFGTRSLVWTHFR